MAYPGSLDSFTTKVDNVTDVLASHVNGLQAAVVTIETELGTDPAGSLTDVKTRLAVSLTDAGYLRLQASSLLTIAAGSVTATKNWHTLDTESAAASDNLDTITAGVDGQLEFFRITSAARVVVVRHNIGNIVTANALSFTLAQTSDLAICIYDGTLSKWIVQGMSAAVYVSGTNTWTGVNTWSAAENHKYTAVSADTTLNTTHYMVNVDATAGAKTITLPTAVGCAGRVYIIRKLDSSANVVTIDGNGSETINGATTKALSAQYSVAQIMSNGANWMTIA